VRIRTEIGLPAAHQVAAPPWFTEAVDGWITIPGAVLSLSGLPMPNLNPEQAMLIELRAVDGPRQVS
jgi:alpha-galactosidase